MNDEPGDGARPGFLRSGGWILVAALAATGAVFAVHVASLLGSKGHARGDGRHPASYGFDLSTSAVPPGEIVASGMPKDGLPALVDPIAWSLAEAGAAGGKRSKFLVPSDRVIGVSLGGAARAYPLRLLVWHEVVNDTLGGRAIAVTYNPLCDSAVVLDRNVGGAPLTFGVSGLLYQSNLLLYDRQPPGRSESLWSQLLLSAVAGPAASEGKRLGALPAAVQTWGDWRGAHPGTTVLAPDARLAGQYKRDPYSSYFGSDLLRFPVNPLAPEDLGPRKTPVVALLVDGTWHAFTFTLLAARADAAGHWSTAAGPVPVEFQVRRDSPQTVLASSGSGPLPTIQAFRFAWWAIHRNDTVWHER